MCDHELYSNANQLSPGLFQYSHVKGRHAFSYQAREFRENSARWREHITARRECDDIRASSTRSAKSTRSLISAPTIRVLKNDGHGWVVGSEGRRIMWLGLARESSVGPVAATSWRYADASVRVCRCISTEDFYYRSRTRFSIMYNSIHRDFHRLINCEL